METSWHIPYDLWFKSGLWTHQLAHPSSWRVALDELRSRCHVANGGWFPKWPCFRLVKQYIALYFIQIRLLLRYLYIRPSNLPHIFCVKSHSWHHSWHVFGRANWRNACHLQEHNQLVMEAGESFPTKTRLTWGIPYTPSKRTKP